MTPVQFSHANGFPAKSYQKLFDLLAPHPVSYVNMIGHGQYRIGPHWRELVQELTDDITRRHRVPVAGIGHSLGGVLTFLAAQQRPELFERVILIDPPMFGPHKRLPIRVAQWVGMAGRIIPPARKARTRRRHFDSRQQAEEVLRSRSLFRPFDPQCFADYMRYGWQDNAQGGVSLAFSADKEYDIFAHTPTRFGDMRLSMPSYFLYARQSDTLDARDVAWLRRQMSNTEFLPVEGRHMFPLEQPEHTAELLRSLLTV